VLIFLLGSSPCRQLNTLGDDISAISHPIPLLGLNKPVDPALAILGEFQQEFLLVATMCNVPRMTGYVLSIRSWQGP